jgi:Uma2 family endonuclease
MTYADLARLPDDGRRFELYDGEPFEVPMPTLRHQRVALHVATALWGYEQQHGGRVVIAPFDVVLTLVDVVQPDVVYFAADRVPALDESGPARIPPDLAVEVLSPGTAANDRGRKMRLLARFGVREYWLVDPVENRLERYSLERGFYVLDGVATSESTVTSRGLTGFTCPAAQIFSA